MNDNLFLISQSAIVSAVFLFSIVSGSECYIFFIVYRIVHLAFKVVLCGEKCSLIAVVGAWVCFGCTKQINW